MTVLLGLDPATYVPHPLHRPDAAYPETNCWTDIVIELLHSQGREPLAVLGCTLALQHEGDQLLFFKPHPADLLDLYGVDIHELQAYRPLRRHLETQLHARRMVIVETDACWLPDTAGTSYRQSHVKTAIAVVGLDEERLTYFHNAGLHQVESGDLARLLGPQDLPGYLEVVRFDAGPARYDEDLRRAATDILRRVLAAAPANPFTALGAQLADELDEVLLLDPAAVHDFAFATTRMGGAAAALAAAHVRWLLPDQAAAADCLDRVAAAARALTFRLVRQRSFDPGPLVTALADDWDRALESLHARVG